MLHIDTNWSVAGPEVWTQEDDGDGVQVWVRRRRRFDGVMRVAEVRASSPFAPLVVPTT